jgi:hypothetical protein
MRKIKNISSKYEFKNQPTTEIDIYDQRKCAVSIWDDSAQGYGISENSAKLGKTWTISPHHFVAHLKGHNISENELAATIFLGDVKL